jgi:glyoxalase family protein
MTAPGLLGIHHVTAICGDAQSTLDFYSGVLGLRLVKVTVNFDDPGAYHFYFGVGVGAPGSVITFFPYPEGRAGRPGHGQIAGTAFEVPRGALEHWEAVLEEHGIAMCAIHGRLGDRVLGLEDPEGLQVELVEPAEAHPSEGERGIVGLSGVTLPCRSLRDTANFLEERLGAALLGREGDRHRYRIGGGSAGFVDLIHAPQSQRANGGLGSVHHVAFAAEDEEALQAWKAGLEDAGLHVSPVMNRDYFRSIYFREPGGALFEIATRGPGFGMDEPHEELGTHLMLPEQYENIRDQIERRLPPVRLPGGTTIGG